MQTSENHKKKVFVGMSGGVDSSVSAALLIEQGYEVYGVYMKNWSGESYGIQFDCPWEEEQAMAEAVCQKLGIPFRSYNFERQYRDSVIEYFFAEFEKGRTPNPDVMCNKTIKFDVFLNRALQDGADYIATGHYAQVRQSKDGSYELLKGADPNKDQTYFLNTFTQEQLSKVLFPIGHMQKPDVRKLAHKFELPSASQPDSQGICFLGEIDLIKFLKTRLPETPGKIINIDTREVLGEHEGVAFYTIGQRQGLGVGGQGLPVYVVDKDVDKNIVYVVRGSKHHLLFKSDIQLEELHFVTPKYADISKDYKLTASVRYRQNPQPGYLDIEQKKFIFDEPQRAITSAQSLVIYDGDVCIGGGVIE